MIENSISLELLARLYSSQLITRGDKHLLNRNRYYYKLLRQVAAEGLERGEFCAEMTVNDIVKLYALLERALLYDWCICAGEYSLTAYAKRMMPLLLDKIRALPDSSAEK